MTKPIISRSNRTITITKAFDKKACKYGTDEFTALASILALHPNFRIIVKDTTPNTNKFTMATIEKYISLHDDENKSIMAELEELRNKEGVYKDKVMKTPFFEIKKWFLEKFPEVA